MSPQYSSNYTNLGEMYLIRMRLNDAENQFRFALQKDSFDIIAWKLLGYLNLLKKNFDEAEKIFMKALAIDNDQVFFPDFDFACLYSMTDKIDLAFESLEKVLMKNFKNYERIKSMPFLNNLRLQKERWNRLIKKYFP